MRRPLIPVVLPLLLLTDPVFAAPHARIDAIWEAEGRAWVLVGESLQVHVDGSEGAGRGDDLELGDTVVTEGARVRIERDDGQLYVLGPDSELVLEEDGVLQALGEVLYEVEGFFRVEHEGVEAAVEGTRFAFQIDESGEVDVVEVHVRDGRVRVANDAGEVLVRRGQGARVEGDNAPELIQKVGAVDLGVKLGPPRQSIGVMFSGAYAADSPQLGTKIIARQRLMSSVALTLDVGIESNGDSFHFPLSGGFETTVGSMALGLQSVNLLGQEVCPDGTTETKLYPGGAVHLRYPRRIVGPLMVEVQVRAGYSRDPFGDVGLGVSLAR